MRGTNGMYEEATDSVFLDRDEDKRSSLTGESAPAETQSNTVRTGSIPSGKNSSKRACRVPMTHGLAGISGIFLTASKMTKPMPVDVYDAASWMAVTALSEASIAKGGVPVEFPDFTKSVAYGLREIRFSLKKALFPKLPRKQCFFHFNALF